MEEQTRHNYFAAGEYTGRAEEFGALLRKLHPSATTKLENGSRFYLIVETLDGNPVRLTVTMMPGKTSIGGNPCYDVWISGHSYNGDCKKLGNILVAEAGINLVPELQRIHMEAGSITPSMPSRLERDIESILKKIGGSKKYL